MGLSVRMRNPATGQDHSFNIARDIAYFYPQLVALAGHGLLQDHWEPWYGDYLKEKGVTEEELTKTVAAFTEFCSNATSPDHPVMPDSLKASGFFDLPQPAQLVFLAKLGQLCAGAFWAGIRAAAHADETPVGIVQLSKAAKLLSEHIADTWGPKRAKAAKRPAQPRKTAGKGNTKTRAKTRSK